MNPSDLQTSDNGRFQTGPAEPTRALVLVPWLKNQSQNTDSSRHIRSPEARLEEAKGLAAAIKLDIIDALLVPVIKPQPATLMGAGKVTELGGQIAAQNIALVIVDGKLSPGQQRNLERAWNAKVLDRTGLILEIFGERARTREGRLQVELAHLSYQKSRLVRSWTHLERQRGGLGFVGGPGETQIESDRRLIQERISKLERQLGTVKRTRELHRKNRRDAPYPVVSLVGYTNAGKSTLFNRITNAGVVAEDLLFATLDPTMRAVCLPSGRTIILSDTVGFISDLPTHLIAAFRATLEEVLEAEIILHVRDIAHPETEVQKQDVLDVLKSLGVTDADDREMIEVQNKLDLLGDAEREAICNQAARDEQSVPVSALTGAGVTELLALLDRRLEARAGGFELLIAPDDAAALAWLHQHTEVQRRETREDGSIWLHLSMEPAIQGRFEKQFPRAAGALHRVGQAAE